MINSGATNCPSTEFEYTFRGLSAPELKKAVAVIVTDAHSCVLLDETDESLSTATVLRSDIV